ncbi:MAG: response regulator transcription factor [Gammaproteobacteria bacterium]|nr:response regulator transcription factor [Gammaproteobacteria bacterium]
MRILVIEDEAPLRELLIKCLKEQGYAVDVATDGEEGLYLGLEFPFDAAIIDLGLPIIEGIDVIRQLRERDKAFPILILTARGRWQEKVAGLEAGADDYMVKPFHIEELLARVKVLLRRSVGLSKPEIKFGPISLNTASQEVTVNDEAIELTSYEYRVLEYLMTRSGDVVSKTELTEHIYDQNFDRDSNVIEVFVGRLRKKLDPENVYSPIETLRGKGYRFTLKGTSD